MFVSYRIDTPQRPPQPQPGHRDPEPKGNPPRQPRR